MDKLTIVIVTYNSREMIAECLAALRNKPPLRIVVVDNNSTDGTPAGIAAHFPAVEVLRQDVNLGYGRAANVVLRAAETPYVLLLNPDLLASPRDIDKLLAHALNDTSDTAIWGPATTRADYTGEPPASVSWVSGSAMLFDVARIRRVGLFDENIFLFSEETDLCERTIAAGYAIKLCGDVFFDHLIGQSSPYDPAIEYMKWWHFGWSQCYRMTKHGHATVLRSPRRKQIAYRFHSFMAISQARRLKCRAKADGALAFIRGEKAFRADGTPQMS